MFTVHCYVCGKEIGFFGWPNHVRMEKKKYGDGIYEFKRLERKKILDMVDRKLKNRSILEFEDVEK